jgi:hypothetical protein
MSLVSECFALLWRDWLAGLRGMDVMDGLLCIMNRGLEMGVFFLLVDNGLG